MAEVNIKDAISVFDESLRAHDLSALSKRVAKRPLVLYFGRATFSDNTKYLFLRDLARQRSYDVLWCTFDRDLHGQLTAAGLPCLDMSANIDVTIDLLLHAAAAVFCVNPNESLRGSVALNACLDGARKLQLWHGVSVKHLLLRLASYLGVRDVNLRRAFEFASRADYVLSTAPHFDRFWRDVFGCRHLVRAGFPRNEVLLREATDVEMIGAVLPPAVDEGLKRARAAGKKSILVVPTWQRGVSTFLTETDFIVRTVQFAREHEAFVVLKMHPTYYNQARASGRTDCLEMLDPGVDIYPSLNRFDALVTDYSSIMFDFLLTGRPVLSLDLDPGQHQSFEPDFSLVPDIEFRTRFTPQNYEAQLRTVLWDDNRAAQRSEMAERIFASDPRRACDRLLALLDELVAQAVADDYSVV